MTDLQDFSRRLFAAADQLWTNSTLRPDQYAQPVLALIALRQMEAKFEAVHAELAPQYKGRLKPAPADYQAKGAIFLPENARFSRLLALPGTADLGAELNAAMKGIAETNPDLAGALPQGYAGLPTVNNANYLWINLFYAALNPTGRAGFVMANSASDAGGSERELREKLIETGAVDCIVAVGPNMFFTVTLPVTLWFLDKGKTKGPRGDKVLFVDARHIFRQVTRAHRTLDAIDIEFLGNIV